MPLEVLIATPSGPLGELIRLTLEANSAFHCTLLKSGEELRAAIWNNTYQAVVYDCSFSQPGPDEVAQVIRNVHPKQALLFIPSESNPDVVQFLSILADGIISRPFDAAVLPELIRYAVEKRASNPSLIESSTTINPEPISANLLQQAIKETSASFGVIINNRAVETATTGINTSLQDQVVSTISRYWNPSDTSDLMRYISDPVENHEWMMYATQIADSRVLALLFQKQTPVTLVRIQSVQLARELAKNQTLTLPVFHPDEELSETQEPPNLQKILDGQSDKNSSNSSTRFPVEWFRESDLPKSIEDRTGREIPVQNSSKPVIKFEPEIIKEVNPDSDRQISDQIDSPKDIPVKTFDFEDFLSVSENVDLPVEIPESSPANESGDNSGFYENEKKQNVSLSETTPVNLDLGSFQPVDLIAESPFAAGLDSLQPVALKSDYLPKETEEDPINPEVGEPIPDEALSDFQTTNFPFSKTDFSVEQVVGHDQNPEIKLPAFDPDKPGLLVENNNFSKINETDNIIPKDLTNFPEFDNLPFFAQTQVNEPSTDDYDIFKTGDMEAALTPGGLYDLPSFGEQAMENDPFEKDLNDSPSSQTDNSFESAGKSEESDVKTNNDLFARMNQLQTAGNDEETETITVALIPWQGSFILQRQIAQIINQRMNKLCQAFGWKLENLTIRPTYMQFTMTITNLFSQEDMVGIVRKQTSLALNENLQDLQLPVDLEDIWAPECMSVVGKEFVPSIQWHNFINRRKNNEIA